MNTDAAHSRRRDGDCGSPVTSWHAELTNLVLLVLSYLDERAPLDVRRPSLHAHPSVSASDSAEQTCSSTPVSHTLTANVQFQDIMQQMRGLRLCRTSHGKCLE
eukprot:2726011-Rhodomonas_salina.1